MAEGCTLKLDVSQAALHEPSCNSVSEGDRISILGVSAKYLSALEKAGAKPRTSHDLGTLRSILSTGSPLAHESFNYVYRDIKSDVWLASMSGGTDLISCFVLGCPWLPVHEGELQAKGLGMAVDVFDEQGRATVGRKGELVCTKSFPSAPTGFWNDPGAAKFHAAYFEKYDNVWAHGDFAEITGTGGMIIHGRSDAVLNPGGVRIGTAEIYRQVEEVDGVVEALCVSQEWDDDTRVVLFVVLREGLELDAALEARIRHQIRSNTTPRHVPAVIKQAPDVPRTMSGKIAELTVRDVIHGREVRNTSALANPESLAFYESLDLS